jgi:hypothetical protein
MKILGENELYQGALALPRSKPWLDLGLAACPVTIPPIDDSLFCIQPDWLVQSVTADIVDQLLKVQIPETDTPPQRTQHLLCAAGHFLPLPASCFPWR